MVNKTYARSDYVLTYSSLRPRPPLYYMPFSQGLKLGLVAAKKLVVFQIWLVVGLNWASSH